MKINEIEYKTMVICSTQNQMVNYLAIKEHGIKNIINLTVNRDESDAENYNLRKFNYNNWDTSLEEVLSKESIYPIYFCKESLEDHESLQEDLGKVSSYVNDNEPILWNITGGQRHFVMAITNYVFSDDSRSKDILIYFDGDEEKYYYYDREGKRIDNDSIPYKNDFPMNIPLALKLMGIEVKSKSMPSKYYNYLINQDNKEIEEALNFYITLAEIYMEYPEFGKALIDSNKEKTGNWDYFLSEVKQLSDKGEIEEKLNKELVNSQYNEFIKKDLRKHINGKVFGYLLEKMTFYTMLKELEKYIDKIADIDLSVETKNDDDNRTNDELDIVLLTRKGKLIVFECKSGKMTGDNAKSTHYTTYRLSGVYGTPVLISPITKKLENSFKNDSEDLLKNIKSAQSSAERAQLLICSLGQGVNLVNDNSVIDIEEYLENVLSN